MKNILTIEIEKFRRIKTLIPTGTLKRLIQAIYEYKWENRDKLNLEIVADIERRQSIIEQEMQRRGFLKKRDYDDYYGWLKKMNFKRRFF